MSNFEDYTGLTYLAGRRDCFSVVRDFLRDTYALDIPNYARPDRFWEDPALDLYGIYAKHGFVQIMDQPLEIGDILLMPLRTPMNSHAAIIVADNLILHHLPAQLSTLDPLRPRWTTLATVILRHPIITSFHQASQKTMHFHEVADARLLQNPDAKSRIASLMAPEG